MALAAAVGGVLGAVGSLAQGSANASMYSYQAGVAQQQAQIDKQNAGYALITGENQAAQSGQASRFQIGRIQSAQGASGFLVGRGTNPQVVRGQRLIANTDETNIRANAAKTAYDYDIGATQAQSQANVYNAAASASETAGVIGAGSSIIGGAGSVSSKWLQGQQYGLNTQQTLFGGFSSL